MDLSMDVRNCVPGGVERGSTLDCRGAKVIMFIASRVTARMEYMWIQGAFKRTNLPFLPFYFCIFTLM